MKVLGIETSCDETAAAEVEDGRRIISNVNSTSLATHAKTGGVIPENAAREQLHYILPVIKEALVGTSYDAIAVTQGPGVIGPFLSVIPLAAVAIVAEPPRALLLFVMIFGLQALIVNIVGPLLFKRTIGLHPVLVLLSFLVGFKLAGAWGAIFAVPIAGVLLIIGSHLVKYLVGSADIEIKPQQHQ